MANKTEDYIRGRERMRMVARRINEKEQKEEQTRHQKEVMRHEQETTRLRKEKEHLLTTKMQLTQEMSRQGEGQLVITKIRLERELQGQETQIRQERARLQSLHNWNKQTLRGKKHAITARVRQEQDLLKLEQQQSQVGLKREQLFAIKRALKEGSGNPRSHKATNPQRGRGSQNRITRGQPREDTPEKPSGVVTRAGEIRGIATRIVRTKQESQKLEAEQNRIIQPKPASREHTIEESLQAIQALITLTARPIEIVEEPIPDHHLGVWGLVVLETIVKIVDIIIELIH